MTQFDYQGHGLDVATLRSIIPIVPSERRRLVDQTALFEGLNNTDLRDDDRFYAVLHARMTTDPAWAAGLNAAFTSGKRNKDVARSPAARLQAWLSQHDRAWAGAMEDLREDFLAALAAGTPTPDMPEPPSPLAEAVLELLLCCYSTKRLAEADAMLPPQAEEVLPSWQEARDVLVTMLGAITVPSQAVADQIIDLGSTLATLCVAHAEASESQRLDEAIALRDRILTLLEDAGEAGEAGEALAAELSCCEAIPQLETLTDHVAPLTAAIAALDDSRTRYEVAGQHEQVLRIDATATRSQLRAAMDAAETAELALEAAQAAVTAVIGQIDVSFSAFAADTGASAPVRKAITAAAASTTKVMVVPPTAATPAIRAMPSETAVTPPDPPASDVGASAALKTPDSEISAPSHEDATEPEALLPAATVERTAKNQPAASSRSDVAEFNDLTRLLTNPAQPAPTSESLAAATVISHSPETRTWNAATPLPDLLAQWLDRNEPALAWHLTRLAEAAGFETPLPAPLLRALVAGPTVTGPYSQATQAMSELLADAMSALEEAEEAGAEASLNARAIAMAALLRPALMSRDTNARDHLSNLSSSGMPAAWSAVVNTLSGLRHDLQPGIADLIALSGAQKTRKLPRATRALEEWWASARSAQGPYAPAHHILHKLLEPNGHLGTLLAAATTEDAAALDCAIDMLTALATNRMEAEALIAQVERSMGRSRTSAINGTALDWLCRKLRETADALLNWHAAYVEDTGELDDHRREQLQRSISQLRRGLEAAIATRTAGDGLTAACLRTAEMAAAALLELIDGRAPDGQPSRASAVFQEPLLRLPALAQPIIADDEPGYENERLRQNAALFDVLCEPSTVPADVPTALIRHLADGAIRPAMLLLEQLAQRADADSSQIAEWRQELSEARSRASQACRAEIKSLRHALEPLQSIDLSTSNQVQLWLERLAVIDQALNAPGSQGLGDPDSARFDIPADFPQLRLMLADARALHDRVRAGIMQDQGERLNKLAAQFEATGKATLATQARDLMANRDNRDLLTVEDIILRLQNGQNVAHDDGDADKDQDAFPRFYPDFVNLVQQTAPQPGEIMSAIKQGNLLTPLDYRELDSDARDRSHQLFERWRTLSNAMGPRKGDLANPLRQLMEHLGFTSVTIEREIILSDQLRSMWMRCDELTAQGWFLPPAFGSQAGGRYPVFLANKNILDDQILRELAKSGRDDPCLLLVFGRMSRQRRESFALEMRKAKQTVLLIDEVQMLYLTGQTSWIEQLFACATPFSYLQPYTTSAGNIPVEMFFGRDDEIAKIESITSDGCLVYGGRQLGKSALLNHVRKRFHNPRNGRHAYYLKIDEMGSQVQSADQIWQEIRRVLLEGMIVPKTGVASPADLVTAIRAWLDQSGGRRILILIDETDNFLSSEVRNGFPNLHRLKDVMEETQRRFKVVFAGLHNVRRLARAPNSPLVHLGQPICIGPMNTSSVSSLQARRLVIEPMRAAAYDYASPDLVQALLTRVNYYPSLIQVFCKALLEGISNQRPRGQGPRWKLEQANVFESKWAEDIKSQIRERFQWTLNLDPRYELIAKVLALHRLNSAGQDHDLSPEKILAAVSDWWPNGYEKLESDDFRAFLEEMVDLGVLIRFGDRTITYGLRGAQVAQMLGHAEQLEREILDIATKEPRPDYDASTYHRRARTDQFSRRSPLSDAALQRLFDVKKPGLRFVVAPRGIWGGETAVALKELADGWQQGERVMRGLLMNSRSGDTELNYMINRERGHRVVIIPADARTPKAWVSRLAVHHTVVSGDVLPVFIGGHADILALSDLAPGSSVVIAKPWEQSMLRSWLAEASMLMLDTVEVRKALLAATGGAPALLEKLRHTLELAISRGEGHSAIEAIRNASANFELMPSEIGLPESLAPQFCDVFELLIEGMAPRSTIEDLLQDRANNWNALSLMLLLGLFAQHDVDGDRMISNTPIGMLLYTSCTRQPGRLAN